MKDGYIPFLDANIDIIKDGYNHLIQYMHTEFRYSMGVVHENVFYEATKYFFEFIIQNYQIYDITTEKFYNIKYVDHIDVTEYFVNEYDLQLSKMVMDKHYKSIEIEIDYNNPCNVPFDDYIEYVINNNYGYYWHNSALEILNMLGKSNELELRQVSKMLQLISFNVLIVVDALLGVRNVIRHLLPRKKDTCFTDCVSDTIFAYTVFHSIIDNRVSCKNLDDDSLNYVFNFNPKFIGTSIHKENHIGIIKCELDLN